MGQTAIAQAVSAVAAGTILVSGCLTIPGHQPGDGGAAAADAAVSCPANYLTAVGGARRYRLLTGPAFATTWPLAAFVCAQDQVGGGTHLIVLSDDAERGAVKDFAASLDIDVWVGLSDRVTPGTWQAVTDEDTAGYPGSSGPAWAPGEPTNGLDCAFLSAESGRLAGGDCTVASKDYLCECDGLDDDPSNYTPAFAPSIE